MKVRIVTVIFTSIFLVNCQKCDPEPKLTTNEAELITAESAQLSGNIYLSDCSLSVTSQGIVYSRNNSFPTTSDQKVQLNSENPSTIINSLVPASTYYFRTYLSNNEGDFYGNVKEFSTPIGQAVLNNLQITQKRAKYIKLKARVSSLGGGSIIRSGVEIALNNSFTENKRVLSLELRENNPLTHIVNELTPNTTYYIRSYIENESGLYYSDIESFSTLSGIVVYDNQEFSSVGKTSANFGLTLIDDGGIDIQEWGFIYANGIDWFYGGRIQQNVSENETINHKCIAQNTNLPLRVVPYYIEVGGSDRILGNQLSVNFSPEQHNLNLSIETLNISDITGQYRTVTNQNGDVLLYLEIPRRTYDNIYNLSTSSMKIHAKRYGVIWKRSDWSWDEEAVSNNWFIFWFNNLIFLENDPQTIQSKIRLGAKVNGSGDKFLPSFNVGFNYQFRIFLVDHDDDWHYSNEVNISIPE